MSKKKCTQEILPWDNGELEALLTGLISHGTEVAKVDFKTEIEAKTPEQKAELLKDIIAIANTYDNENYEDHGFIIYGVKAKTIDGITQTESDTDKFQNHIEQLLKNYISPMPQIYIIGFETPDGKKWGAIVIPPRNNKPYMFFKDLSCPTNRTRTRRKGEWFVRRGSTTDPGFPEDFAIITQRQMEFSLDPLRESIRSLQSRVGKVEEQYNSALFKLVERALSALPESNGRKLEEKEEISSDIGGALDMDLPNRLQRRLKTPADKITEDLIAEAKTIRNFLNGADTSIPWAPQLNNSPANKKIIEDLEEKTRSFQISIATIVINDHKGIYTDALLRAIKILARITSVPSGTSYNRIGKALRYYPLGLVIYTIFICGVATDRPDLLKKVLEIPLRGTRKGSYSHITDIFFYWYEAKALFNDAFTQRWCEPIGQRIRQVISDHIGEMITEFEEPEYFFHGEFVLALIGIDIHMENQDIKFRRPLPGLYLYSHEASDTITNFIFEHPEWFEGFYNYPMTEILDMFDRNANSGVSSGCIALGIHDLNTSEIYQKFLHKKAK